MKERSDTLYLLNTIIRPIEVDAMRLFSVVNHIEGVSFGDFLDLRVRLEIADLLSLWCRRRRYGQRNSEHQDRETATLRSRVQILSRPAPQGRRHAEGSQYRRAHPIFAAVPVLTIGLIWRSTNQEAFAN